MVGSLFKGTYGYPRLVSSFLTNYQKATVGYEHSNLEVVVTTKTMTTNSP